MGDDTEKRYLDLAEETRQAFADIEYPGDENLVNSLAYDESIEVATAFKGKHWKELPLELVYKYRTDSHLLTPAAFRFYFPAFLIGGILQAEYDDKYVDDGLVYLSCRLIPPETASPEMERFLDNISGFSLQQKKVAKKFMQLFLETNPYYFKIYGKRTNDLWDNLVPD